MNRWTPILFAFLLATIAPSAWAQCEGTWDNERVGKRLDEVDAALAQADLSGAKTTLNGIDKGLGCVEELIDKGLLGRYARAVGLLRFYQQDEPQAIKWGLLARMVDPNGTWPGELPEGHPYLELLGEEEDPAKVRAEGWLVPPEKGSVFVNGDFIPEPETYAEIPGLVQLFDRVGFPIETFWQDGAAFRADLISEEGGPIEVPKYYDPETGELKGAKAPAKVKTEKIKVEKAPSDFPVVPVATAGGLALASGLSYLGASAAHGGLANATEESQLTRARSTTNILVVVSAVTGAGAVGVGLGTVLATHNGVVWHVRF